MDPELLDRIYESSFAPELWPGVLGELAQLIDAPQGALNQSIIIPTFFS
jgi:hypothetical protein